MQDMNKVAQELGLNENEFIPYGKNKGKIDAWRVQERLQQKNRGKLVLVSAVNPTAGGEGKTTTSLSLAMGLRMINKRAVAALREPSLGPVFGIKGGGTGGGKAQMIPSEDINLHFTGDLHAITSAHNLLSAIVDNALHFGGEPHLDPRRVTWRRALDMNDRSLRNVTVGLSGENGGRTGGVPRETGFDITAASEVMAVFCLASSFEDLVDRLGRIVVGQCHDKKPVTAKDLGAHTAMAVLLKDALLPNLAQTTEGGPVIVHGGPFANIAHGCSSVLATRLGLLLSDIVVTEAGFGCDLGAEKFLDIKMRSINSTEAKPLWPDMMVLVATVRALKSHGGVSKEALGSPNMEALKLGMANLEKHIETARAFGLPVLVSINRFPTDTEEELRWIQNVVLAKHTEAQPVDCALCEGFGKGGAGAIELAEKTVKMLQRPTPLPQYLYDVKEGYKDKILKIVEKAYGGSGVDFTSEALDDLGRIEAQGQTGLPVCMAKTPLSLSDDPKKIGRPPAFRVTVRGLRLSAGAGFVVALLGDVMTMPGLPKVPAARNVKLHSDGSVTGLMQND